MRGATSEPERVAPPPTPRCSLASNDGLLSLRVSTILLRSLLDVVQKRGISAEALLGDRTHFLDGEPGDQSLSFDEFQSMYEHAIQLTGEPALGLHCGLWASEASYGLMAPLVAHAATLRQAIALVSQFGELLIEGARLRLTESGGVAQLRCEFAGGYNARTRSFIEQMVAGVVRTLHAFGCTRADIRGVCFEYPIPAHFSEYSLAFSGAEQFAQPFTGVDFRAEALDRPNLHRHSELQALMLAQAERSLARRSQPLSYSQRVTKLLSSRTPNRLPDMASASRELGISVRSLRRRLDEEKTSYRQLAQCRLFDASCGMLRNPQLTLQEVAHAIGFADSTAFHRAFKRWSDVTPAEYRAGHVPGFVC